MINFVRRVVVAAAVAGSACMAADAPPRLSPSARNLLVRAKVSGSLGSYGGHLRGDVNHMVYSLQRRDFVTPSQWHEYGVAFGQKLGVVPENRPAWWMAEWPESVKANLILLTGTYPNQPQPDTAWKIEVRLKGQWQIHERGVGGVVQLWPVRVGRVGHAAASPRCDPRERLQQGRCDADSERPLPR